jgi:uncharacterized protein with PIN domain
MGRKKFTYEYVKKYVEADGTILRSLEYMNNHTKLKFMCPKGHAYSTTFNNFKSRGSRCPHCAGNAKPTFEFVKEFVEADGTKLLSTEYINWRSTLEFICPKGHKYSNNYNNFKRKGQRCPICAGVAKYTYEFVKTYVETGGTKLLSTEYINAYTKLELMCPKGHRYFMRFSNFKNAGNRCPKCAGLAKPTLEAVKEYVEADGTTLCSPEYVNSKTSLDFMCPKGHKYSNNFSNFKHKGQRCPKCSAKRIAKKLSLDFREVKQFVEADGTKLLSPEYVNSRTKMRFLCPKGHEYLATFHSFKTDGSRCPTCSGGKVSKISQEWLDSLNIPGLEREYPIIVNSKKYFVDGLDPLTGIIYEFLGDYYHGNPVRFKPEDINFKLKKSYGQLYKETFERFEALKSAGYKIKYIWEKDFRKGKELQEWLG